MNYYVMLIEADGSKTTTATRDRWAKAMVELKESSIGIGSAELYAVTDEKRFKEFQEAMRNAGRTG